MKLIKRTKITYHISSCGNCFYNSAIYCEDGCVSICQKTMHIIINDNKILKTCPLENDNDDRL